MNLRKTLYQRTFIYMIKTENLNFVELIRDLYDLNSKWSFYDESHQRSNRKM